MAKEYELDGRKLISVLHCVSVDCFKKFCFLVEDQPGLMEEYGSNPIKMSNWATLVKSREKSWPNHEKKKPWFIVLSLRATIVSQKSHMFMKRKKSK